MFSDFNNYSKWFTMHSYDYAIYSDVNGFKATATLRGSSAELESSFYDSPQEAVHALYMAIKGIPSSTR